MKFCRQAPNRDIATLRAQLPDFLPAWWKRWHEFGRYVFFGGVNTVLTYVIYLVIHHLPDGLRRDFCVRDFHLLLLQRTVCRQKGTAADEGAAIWLRLPIEGQSAAKNGEPQKRVSLSLCKLT
jgi:hypothetical protein